MQTTYTIRAVHPNGRSDRAEDDLGSLEATLAEGAVGEATLEYASDDLYDLLVQDARVYLYRKPFGGLTRLVGRAAWFVVQRTVTYSATGALLTVRARHCNSLLERHTIAANTGASESDKSGYAGNLMRAVIREQFGASAGTGRDLSAVVAVGNDLGDGASVAMSGARQDVLSVCRDLAQKSMGAGSYITYNVDAVGETGFLFRTNATALGVDRRLGRASVPLVFSRANQNVADLTISDDWTKLVTHVYVGGAGEKSLRAVQTVSDSGRVVGTFGRIERFVDATNAGVDTTQLDSAGYQALREGQGRIVFEAKYVPTELCVFGRDFDWGDYVTGMDGRGRTFDVRLPSVTLRLGDQGETVDIALKGER